jgi:hypothetical protein
MMHDVLDISRHHWENGSSHLNRGHNTFPFATHTDSLSYQLGDIGKVDIVCNTPNSLLIEIGSSNFTFLGYTPE